MRHRYRKASPDRFLPHPVAAVFGRCDRSGVRMCVLRDAGTIAAAKGGEVDLLLDPHHLEQARAAFRDEGFVELSSWGHHPHHFFVRYEAAFDRWIKCDVVTQLVFGGQQRWLPTDLGGACLERRRRNGALWVLSVEDELVTLLLHEMLDKQAFRPHRIARLKELRASVTCPERIDSHLRTCWPASSWPQIAYHIDHDAWAALLARAGEVRRAIRKNASSQVLAQWRRRMARWYGRMRGIVTPQAPSVSLLAPDGAGKSSLIEDVARHFFGPASSVYMGLQQRRTAARRRMPPGAGLVAALLNQWRRYLSARYRQSAGQLVLFDRYSYDAWLPAPPRRGFLSAWRRAILARACPAPDLSIVLDAPAEVLFARKPERPPHVLEAQRQCYRSLQRRVPRVVIVDATLPPADVRRTVMALVWERYRYGRHAPATAPLGKA